MSRRWLPCKRNDFIKKLRSLGFEGPYAGKRHEVMVIMERRLAIPSDNEYSVAKLREMVREVEGLINHPITLDEWEEL